VQNDIHPKYTETKVICGCGNTFATRSTSSKPELKVDICNACHPFYTGKLKYVDTAGRIERFKSRFGDTGYASVKGRKKKAAAEPAEE
jgi:large subunit ribosomal protein L31